MRVRILVVAADKEVADLVADVLEDDGHDVLRASGGGTTLASVRGEGYHLLVTDTMFPMLDGAFPARYLRDYPGLALPIVLLAFARPLPTPPNTTFLAMPFNIDALSGPVAGLLAKARGGYW